MNTVCTRATRVPHEMAAPILRTGEQGDQIDFHDFVNDHDRGRLRYAEQASSLAPRSTLSIPTDIEPGWPGLERVSEAPEGQGTRATLALESTGIASETRAGASRWSSLVQPRPPRLRASSTVRRYVWNRNGSFPISYPGRMATFMSSPSARHVNNRLDPP